MNAAPILTQLAIEIGVLRRLSLTIEDPEIRAYFSHIGAALEAALLDASELPHLLEGIPCWSGPILPGHG